MYSLSKLLFKSRSLDFPRQWLRTEAVDTILFLHTVQSSCHQHGQLS